MFVQRRRQSHPPYSLSCSKKDNKMAWFLIKECGNVIFDPDFSLYHKYLFISFSNSAHLILQFVLEQFCIPIIFPSYHLFISLVNTDRFLSPLSNAINGYLYQILKIHCMYSILRSKKQLPLHYK